MEQNHAARKLNPKNTMENYKNNNPSLTGYYYINNPLRSTIKTLGA